MQIDRLKWNELSVGRVGHELFMLLRWKLLASGEMIVEHETAAAAVDESLINLRQEEVMGQNIARCAHVEYLLCMCVCESDAPDDSHVYI